MPTRSRTRDANEAAFDIVSRITRRSEGEPEPATEPEREKDPHAVALGKKGGAKGGRARAANMTAEERSAAARKAVAVRWAKKSG